MKSSYVFARVGYGHLRRKEPRNIYFLKTSAISQRKGQVLPPEALPKNVLYCRMLLVSAFYCATHCTLLAYTLVCRDWSHKKVAGPVFFFVDTYPAMGRNL